jgi:hypothetical protein
MASTDLCDIVRLLNGSGNPATREQPNGFLPFHSPFTICSLSPLRAFGRLCHSKSSSKQRIDDESDSFACVGRRFTAAEPVRLIDWLLDQLDEVSPALEPVGTDIRSSRSEMNYLIGFDQHRT